MVVLVRSIVTFNNIGFDVLAQVCTFERIVFNAITVDRALVYSTQDTPFAPSHARHTMLMLRAY